MGRPAEFDEDEVLDRAMRAFWKAGFEGTSLDDLVQATGVGRQSLYNAFGDKKALFMRCLRRYSERSRAALVALLERERPVRRGFAALFERFLAESDEEKRMGCLLVNTAMELARSDVEVGDLIARNQAGLEATFLAALEAGRARRELPARADCAALARYFTGVLFGVTVLLKSDPRSPAARDMVAVALQALDR